jgi:hypothetical protein
MTAALCRRSSASTIVTAITTSTSHIAADANRVYWGDVAGRIWAAPSSENAVPTQLAMVGVGVTLLTSDDTRLFWAAQQDATGRYGERCVDAIEETRARAPRRRHPPAHRRRRGVYWTDGGAARNCK